MSQLVRAGEALRHVHHALALERDRVDGAGDEQVVADRDARAGPPPRSSGRPRCPRRRRGRTTSVDLAVVARQVVLGEQVDDERGAGDARSTRDWLGPTPRRRARRRSRGPGSTARTRAASTPWRRSGGGRVPSRRPARARPGAGAGCTGGVRRSWRPPRRRLVCRAWLRHRSLPAADW